MLKRNLLVMVLLAILVISVYNFISMRINIAKKNQDIEEITNAIKEQKIHNNEYTDILSDENTEDFYKNIAEDTLGYGLQDEKIYVDITGH
jgi:cell division protein FtsL